LRFPFDLNNWDFVLEQRFVPIMTTMFTTLKKNDKDDKKIPLVFLEDDADVNRWIKIEENYMNGFLLDSFREFGGKRKWKPLMLFEFKVLYGFYP